MILSTMLNSLCMCVYWMAAIKGLDICSRSVAYVQPSLT